MNLLASLSRRALIEIVGGAIALLALALIASAWRQAHDDRLRMEAAFAAQKPLIAAAEARERSRDAQLTQLLAQIDALKKRTLSPAEIVAQLNQQLPLPQPITIASPTGSAPRSPAKRRQARQGTLPAKWRAWEIGQALALPQAEVSRPVQALPVPGAAAPQHFPAAQPQQGSAPSPESHPAEAPPELPEAPGVHLPALDLKPLFNYVQDCRACQARLSVAQADLADEKARSQALTHERDAALQAARGGSFWTRLKRNTRWFLTGAAAGAVLARGL